MAFYELTVHCAQYQLDDLEDLLAGTGYLSITLKDARNNPIYEPKPGEMPLWDWVRLTVLYDDTLDHQRALLLLSATFPEHEWMATKLDDRVWERVWMEYFKPMRFGKKTWVIPVGYQAVEPEAVNVFLDPGLAFGTGTHATTSLCLEYLDRCPPSSHVLMDFGCGSGILAVTALKHGAKKVYCTDIDPQAIDATLMNARTNNVDVDISIINSDQLSEIVLLDGVIANILAAPLIQLEEVFASMLKINGYIVLSGILRSQIDRVVDKYSNRFVDIEVKIKEDWALLFARKSSVKV